MSSLWVNSEKCVVRDKIWPAMILILQMLSCVLTIHFFYLSFIYLKPLNLAKWDTSLVAYRLIHPSFLSVFFLKILLNILMSFFFYILLYTAFRNLYLLPPSTSKEPSIAIVAPDFNITFSLKTDLYSYGLLNSWICQNLVCCGYTVYKSAAIAFIFSEKVLCWKASLHKPDAKDHETAEWISRPLHPSCCLLPYQFSGFMHNLYLFNMFHTNQMSTFMFLKTPKNIS